MAKPAKSKVKAKTKPKPVKARRNGGAKSRSVSKSVKAEVVEVEPSEVVEAEILDAEPIEATDTKAIAPTDPVTAYLAEIRRYPLLSKEQEYDLAVKYHTNRDPAVAQVLVTSNLRFVVKIAAEYSKFGARLIDLIQEGNVGLMHAVREFNPYKGTRLITYAVWWIRGYIREYLLRQYSMVKIGTTQDQKKLFYNLAKEKEAIESEGLVADTKLLSSRLGVKEKDVKIMQARMGSKDISLDAPIDAELKTSLLDLQTDSEGVSIDDQLSLLEQIELLKKNIDKIRPTLNEKELYLLEHRLLADSPITLQDIGDKYQITREAVRQMEARLINKLKNMFVDQEG